MEFLLSKNAKDDEFNYAILILNQPVLNPEFFSRVWNKGTTEMAYEVKFNATFIHNKNTIHSLMCICS